MPRSERPAKAAAPAGGEYRPLREVLTAPRAEVFTSDWKTVDSEHLAQFSQATYETEEEIDFTIVSNSLLGGEYLDGFLLVSMLIHFHWNDFPFRDADTWALNYGLDRVRFPAPVWVGERIRCRADLLDATERGPGRILVRTNNTIDIAGREKPAMVADWSCLFVEGKKGWSPG